MSSLGASQAAAGASNADPIRVMVVDDALVIRGMLSRMLEEAGDISVVASAGDGERALAQLKRNPVDVVVLDIEMPRMDGIEALPKIVSEYPNIQVVMASTLTKRNAEISLKAMELGAADYVTKPGSTGELRSADEFKRELVEKVRSLGRAARRRAGRNAPKPTTFRADPAKPTTATLTPKGREVVLRPLKPFRPEALAIGSSTGGPQALMRVLKDLGEVRQPIFITQHMPPTFTTILAEHIGRSTGRKCVEGVSGMAVESGGIYLAPGERHMLIRSSGGRTVIELTEDPPENFCRPAVDPMLRSLSTVYGAKLLVTILTGMGSDGAKGGKVCVDAGAQVLAQDEATSVVWGMPGAAATAGICGAVLPLDKIGQEIRRFAVDGGRP
ncbi:MAG: chemotaxis response regulator protein-glutamate methylesterase [Alphaproteobacteria bacterium]|nr:chemotaxis response regulator protein-glutamate methylesterase [Alphaproteobacteria bacterium]